MCGDDTSDSPYIFLNGNNGDGSNEKGKIVISAQDLTTMNIPTYLTLYPDGRFQLRSHDMPSTMDIRAAGVIQKSINLSGYIKYASGLILQWGKYTFNELNTNQDFNYPISFTTNNSCVLATIKGSYSFEAYSIVVSGSQLSFSAHVQNEASGVTFYWFAIGY